MTEYEYTMTDLAFWNEKIEKLTDEIGLNCYEQHFEICSYEDMLCYEAYTGMPSHYHHWSFGKAYERQKTFYQYNLTGLPYEMVINSDPCIAYLMRDNTLLLQILTMAHVYGHNDFFRNNRLFKQNTRAELTIELFKAHANRVRDYIQNPGIGPEKVERILDGAHALKFQITRTKPEKPRNRAELEEDRDAAIPERFKNDLLGFLAERGRLSEWERDLIHIVRDEALYFIPQIETKIMNEGWASYWHYQILKNLELPQGLYLEFIQRHNLVIRPHQGRVNPYFVGFKVFEYLDKTGGREKIMAIRAEERDQSFLRRYLTRELCEEMHLFSYDVEDEYIVVTEVSDEEGWKTVRDQLVNSVGMSGMPVIKPMAVEKGTLVLEHDFDGRELELQYAQQTLKYIVDLWGGKVVLHTKINGKDKRLICTENKEIADLK
ncbi:MAG TPA: SpoVR family protein [Methylomusa anaerophila]|uniref:SpoVR family protein n=1 Tax=Methylomusa anaerophila TaxID=1930071 RepID=A0A348ANS1_9FIRM|nr:SpoVR family protein [Methylomusa anaerophila]BBB92719.1 SpoVR family protein [Methylomusa anaerophila]HML87428.1 SpoVR family protein [Methylomusa anaerophila]